MSFSRAGERINWSLSGSDLCGRAWACPRRIIIVVRQVRNCFAAPAATFFAPGGKEGKTPLGFEWMRFHGVRRSSQTLCTPNPKGYGSSAQGLPCVRRTGNRTVPAPIGLPPRSIQSELHSTEQGACCCASFVPAQYLISLISYLAISATNSNLLITPHTVPRRAGQLSAAGLPSPDRQ